jgi:hypothetical protein
MTFSAPLGETSLIDVHGKSLHLVRGNHYLQLKFTPQTVTAPSPSSIKPLEPVAQRLDAYLSTRTLLSSQHRKPNLRLGTLTPRSLRVGHAITLSADGDDFALVDGTSSNGAAVICAGRKGETKQVEFFAVDEGEAELSLHVAHKETLAPGTETWGFSSSTPPQQQQQKLRSATTGAFGFRTRPHSFSRSS